MLLQGMIRGYCADIPFLKAAKQEAKLQTLGVTRIYVLGKREEDFAAACDSLRNGDVLAVVGTVRVFGEARKDMAAAIQAVHNKNAEVWDVDNNLYSRRDGFAMADVALKKVQGSAKLKGSKRFAKAIGGKGGKSKGESAALQREGIADESVIRAITNAPELTWDRKVEILGITEHTLRRHYYDKPQKRKKR